MGIVEVRGNSHRRWFLAAAVVVIVFGASWLLGRLLIWSTYSQESAGLLVLFIPERAVHPIEDYYDAFNRLMAGMGWGLVVPLLVVFSLLGNLPERHLSRLITALRKHWAEIYFALGIAIVVFGYGVGVGMFRLFPYELIDSARSAWRELMSARDLDSYRSSELLTDRRVGGVIVYDRGRADDGLNFLTLFTGQIFELALMDMEGKVLHRWRAPASESLPFAHPDILWQLPDRHQFIHGAHLFQNGDVLFNYDYAGLIKLDRCSKVVWVLDEPTHHTVLVEEDGTIWVPSRTLVRDAAKALPRIRVPYWDDQLLELSSDGEVLSRISILESLRRSKHEGLFLEGPPAHPAYLYDDPLHLNDVEIVTPQLAARQGALATGDLLLSLRDPNALIAIDRESGLTKWSLRGPLLRQHDPDILPDGTLLVFDNRMDLGRGDHPRHLTEPQVFGYSRVVRIDPGTTQTLWSYEGSREQPLYSSIQGKVQALANGNVLVVESEGGRVLEIEPETGSIVWEFINLLRPEDGLVGRITQADRLPPDRASFAGKTCE